MFCNNKNCVHEKEQKNSSVAAQFFFYEFYLLVETETIHEYLKSFITALQDPTMEKRNKYKKQKS